MNRIWVDKNEKKNKFMKMQSSSLANQLLGWYRQLYACQDKMKEECDGQKTADMHTDKFSKALIVLSKIPEILVFWFGPLAR